VFEVRGRRGGRITKFPSYGDDNGRQGGGLTGRKHRCQKMSFTGKDYIDVSIRNPRRIGKPPLLWGQYLQIQLGGWEKKGTKDLTGRREEGEARSTSETSNLTQRRKKSRFRRSQRNRT